MNSRETGCLGVAAALALSALASDAGADEAAVRAPVSPAARPRSAQLARSSKPDARPRASVASRPHMARSPAASGTLDVALSPLGPPMLAPVAPAGAVAPSAVLAPVAQTQAPLPKAGELAASSAQPTRPAASDGTPAQSTREADALQAAERLLGEGVPLELFQAVIVPAARGVTIAQIQGEGTTQVTVSVRPTKITRGSGLVAVGQF